MIVVDSREKKWEHIKTYFDRSGVLYKDKVRLDAGDYFNTEYPYVVVDRKNSLQEICTNLTFGKDNYHRFVRECRRAYQRHIKLIVLIEGTSCKTMDDVVEWKSKFSNHTGHWLRTEMKRISYMYGVEWQFCTKKQTAARILEITHYEHRRNKSNGHNGGRVADVRNTTE